MDRIDLWLEVDRVMPAELSDQAEGVTSEELKRLVEKAREKQEERFKKSSKKILRNAEMSARDLTNLIKLDGDSRKTLDLAAEHLGFSPRVYHRMIKVARTIADLEGSPDIKSTHILEAVEYRPKKFDV